MSRGHDLVARLRAERVIDPDGRPGPAARRWSPGSFLRVAVDDPGRETLYSSRGGFRVGCPSRGVPIVRAFEAAVTRWRSASGPRELLCPACGALHPLDAVEASPPIAFGRFAIVTSDVGHADLAAEGIALAEEELGPTRMVATRG